MPVTSNRGLRLLEQGLRQHAEGENLADIALAAHVDTVLARLRTVEVLYLEVMAVFQACSSIHALSFTQDGDTDAQPRFFYRDVGGQTVSPKKDQTLAQVDLNALWLNRVGPTIHLFFEHNDGRVFSRETLVKDLSDSIQTLFVPLDSPHMAIWRSSFLSRLENAWLSYVLPSAPERRDTPRM